MTFPARSASGNRLADLMRQYVAGLDQKPQFQDGIEMSDAEIAQQEIEQFIQWLEDNDHR